MVIAMINETAPALAEDLHDGRAHLWDLLDRWMTLDETRATWEQVEALYHEIVAFWHADPDAAEEWYRAWHEMHAASRAADEPRGHQDRHEACSLSLHAPPTSFLQEFGPGQR